MDRINKWTQKQTTNTHNKQTNAKEQHNHKYEDKQIQSYKHKAATSLNKHNHQNIQRRIQKPEITTKDTFA